MYPMQTCIYASVQCSRLVVSDSSRPQGPQHARPPCSSPTPGLLKLMSIESLMPSNHLLLCHPIILLPLVFTNFRVFSNELAFHTLLLLIFRGLWPWIWDSASSFWFVLTRDSLECGDFHFEAKKFDTCHAFFSPWKQVFLLCLNIKRQ